MANQGCLGVECIYDDKRSKGGIKTGVIERLAQRLGVLVSQSYDEAQQKLNGADTIENMFLGQGVLLQQLLQVRDSNTIASKLVEQPLPSFTDHTERLKRSLRTLGLDSTKLDTAPVVSSVSTSLPKRKRDAELWTSSKRNIQAPPAALNAALPSPKALELVLEAYFKLVHPWIPIIHPSTFLKRARESPRSTGVVLILNAIVAVAARYITDQDYADVKHRATDCRQGAIMAAIESNSLEALQSLLIIAFDTVSYLKQ